MIKLLAFYDNFIIVEENNKWYMPNKIIKLEKGMTTFRTELLSDLYGDFWLCNNPPVDRTHIKAKTVPIKWDYKFDVGFAYIKEAGILGII